TKQIPSETLVSLSVHVQVSNLDYATAVQGLGYVRAEVRAPAWPPGGRSCGKGGHPVAARGHVHRTPTPGRGTPIRGRRTRIPVRRTRTRRYGRGALRGGGLGQRPRKVGVRRSWNAATPSAKSSVSNSRS